MRSTSRAPRLLTWCIPLFALVPLAVATTAAPAGALPRTALARDPNNRLTASRVWRGLPGATVAAGDFAAPATDGSSATAVTIAAGEVLEFQFIGAPRWLSVVTVQTDALQWRVDVRGLDGQWTMFGAGSSRAADHSVTVTGEALQAVSVRFVPVAAQPASSAVRLAEIAARFSYHDPDDVGRAAAGDTYHSDWVNHYSGDTNDLTKCDDDSRDLRDALQNHSWTTWEHTETNAHEAHFKSTVIGTGDNNDHADNADLAYFSGHGSSSTVDPVYTGTALGSMLLDDETHDDATLVPSDMDDSWGNGEMEWLISTSCRTLRGEGRPYWKWGMEGVHLLCGSDSSIADQSYGEVLGDELIDNGIFDSPITVKQSWFDAMEEWNGGHDVAVVQGETSVMGTDYIWGEGSVAADPVVDNTSFVWLYDVGATAPSRGQFPVAPRLRDPVRIRATGPAAWTVRIDRADLERPAAAQMPVWNVVPRTVDSLYVRNLSNHVCSVYGQLCATDIGSGASNELTSIQGPYQLRVRTETGGFSLTDVSNWMAVRAIPPQLLTGQAALTQADLILTQLNVKPADATATGVSYLWQRGENATGPGSLAAGDTSFAIATKVSFTRRVGTGEGYPVFGPGASISVTMGNNGALQRIFGRGWRQLSQGAPASILPLGSLLPALSALGNGALLDPVRQPMDSLVITSWDLGYFEPGCREAVSALRPTYRLHCICYEGTTTFAADFSMYADALPLDATILTPVEGFTVPPGSTVCFSGSANGGTPPYNAEWVHDDGEIYAGWMWCRALGMPSDPHSNQDSVRTMTLRVTDNRGAVAESKVHVRLATVTAAALDDGVQAGMGFQPVPSRLQEGGTIAFRLPEGAARGPVSLRLVDPSGRIVRTLFEGQPRDAVTAVRWHRTEARGRTLAAGVYWLVLEAPTLKQSRRVLVLD